MFAEPCIWLHLSAFTSNCTWDSPTSFLCSVRGIYMSGSCAYRTAPKFSLFCDDLVMQCFDSTRQASLKSQGLCCLREKISLTDTGYSHWKWSAINIMARGPCSPSKGKHFSLCELQSAPLLYLLKLNKPQSLHSLPGLFFFFSPMNTIEVQTQQKSTTLMYGLKNCASALQTDSKSLYWKYQALKPASF